METFLKSGDNSKEVTPVPISNTVVKLLSADDTWWEAAWKSRTSPVFYSKRVSVHPGLFCFITKNSAHMHCMAQFFIFYLRGTEDVFALNNSQ